MNRKLTKFEETRLLSARAYEIASGAKPKIDLKKEGLEKVVFSRDYIKIAKREYELGLLDLQLYSK